MQKKIPVSFVRSLFSPFVKKSSVAYNNSFSYVRPPPTLGNIYIIPIYIQ
jgi:hypothetical protein